MEKDPAGKKWRNWFCDSEDQDDTSGFADSGQMIQGKGKTLFSLLSELHPGFGAVGIHRKTVAQIPWRILSEKVEKANILSTVLAFLWGQKQHRWGKDTGLEDTDEETIGVLLDIVGEISMEMSRSNQVRLG